MARSFSRSSYFGCTCWTGIQNDERKTSVSSLHNDLATWAARARARGQETIYLDLETADKISNLLMGSFQDRVKPWMDACFGEEISRDRQERNHRFLEEALELVQAKGCTASEAHQLVDYVYGRPAGDAYQEVGGVMVTLAALCLANALDMHEAAETELQRIWTKVEAIRAKQAAKPKNSPLP